MDRPRRVYSHNTVYFSRCCRNIYGHDHRPKRLYEFLQRNTDHQSGADVLYYSVKCVEVSRFHCNVYGSGRNDELLLDWPKRLHSNNTGNNGRNSRDIYGHDYRPKRLYEFLQCNVDHHSESYGIGEQQQSTMRD